MRDKLAKQRMQPVRKEDGERMAKDLGAVKYVECSALTQYKLKDVFDEVGFSALNDFFLNTLEVCALNITISVRVSVLKGSRFYKKKSYNVVYCSTNISIPTRPL